MKKSSNKLTSRITYKGQATIPLAVRDALHLVAGDYISFEKNEVGEFILKKNTLSKKLAGSLKQYASWNGSQISQRQVDDKLDEFVAERWQKKDQRSK